MAIFRVFLSSRLRLKLSLVDLRYDILDALIELSDSTEVQRKLESISANKLVIILKDTTDKITVQNAGRHSSCKLTKALLNSYNWDTIAVSRKLFSTESAYKLSTMTNEQFDSLDVYPPELDVNRDKRVVLSSKVPKDSKPVIHINPKLYNNLAQEVEDSTIFYTVDSLIEYLIINHIKP